LLATCLTRGKGVGMARVGGMAPVKYCSKCDTEKHEEDFNFKDKKRGKRQSWCRACQREYKNRHYVENRRDYINGNQDRRFELRKYAAQLMREEIERNRLRGLKRGQGCGFCERRRPHNYRLYWIDPETFKLGQVDRYASWGYSRKRIKEMADRSTLICGACYNQHRYGFRPHSGQRLAP